MVSSLGIAIWQHHKAAIYSQRQRQLAYQVNSKSFSVSVSTRILGTQSLMARVKSSKRSITWLRSSCQGKLATYILSLNYSLILKH